MKCNSVKLVLALGLMLSSLGLAACHDDHPRSAGSYQPRDDDHRDRRD